MTGRVCRRGERRGEERRGEGWVMVWIGAFATVFILL
jgi:hypothetical protein